MGKIRLGCMFCDRNDFDGVDAIPAAWFSVDEIQSYEASIKAAGANEDHCAWYTHLGVCPECQESAMSTRLAKNIRRRRHLESSGSMGASSRNDDSDL